MLDLAVIALRFVQYAAAMMLFGASLVLPKSLGPDAPFPARAWLAWAAGGLALSALAGLLAQTCLMAGSIADGLTLDALVAVVTTMALGPASLVRAAAGLSVLALLVLGTSGRRSGQAVATAGGLACASFAWMGHGAATEGPGRLVHLAADIAHALAAGLWLGALGAFLLMARPAGLATAVAREALHAALHRFAGLGSAAVGVLIATGLINSWFLVGPSHLGGLLTTTYGGVLAAKLGLFALMLGLAAANRFRLTPGLGQGLTDPAALPQALTRLRHSLCLETLAGLAVLGLVAWLGTLAPPADL